MTEYPRVATDATKGGQNPVFCRTDHKAGLGPWFGAGRGLVCWAGLASLCELRSGRLFVSFLDWRRF